MRFCSVDGRKIQPFKNRLLPTVTSGLTPNVLLVSETQLFKNIPLFIFPWLLTAQGLNGPPYVDHSDENVHHNRKIDEYIGGRNYYISL